MISEQQVEQRLRAFFREEVGYDEAAPVTLRDALPEITAGAPGGLFGMRRAALLMLAATVLAIAAIGAILTLSQPRPTPLFPLPPSTLNLWMVIRNERSAPIEYSFSGGQSGGGALIGCQVGVSSEVLAAPWTVEIDGETVLTSADRAAAYAGLAPGGDVLITVVALPDADIQVSTVEVGTGLGTDASQPASCSGWGEPGPGVEIPPELVGSWWVDVPSGSPIAAGVYEVYFLEGVVEHYDPEGGHGMAEYLQGAVIGLDAETITFGSNEVCETAGTYAWVLDESQQTLTLAPIDDECPARVALLTAGPLSLHSPYASPAPAEALPSAQPMPSV